jgi:hypothetical protein
LAPEPPWREHFARTIRDLAGRLGTVPFEPHVTLLSGLPGEPGRLSERAGRLAGELGPVALAFREARHEPRFFRCLYLRAEKEPALLAAHARAAVLFARSPDPSFLPHLSLVYAHLRPDVAARLCAELDPEFPACRATTLEVVHTEGPPQEWRVVASHRLSLPTGPE